MREERGGEEDRETGGWGGHSGFRCCGRLGSGVFIREEEDLRV